MFELVRGDVRELEGKVLIYSQLNADLTEFKEDSLIQKFDPKFLLNSKKLVMAYFASLNRDDVLRRLNYNEKDTKKVFTDSLPVDIPERGVTANPEFSVVQLGFYPEENFKKELSDIVYAGSYSYPSLARQSMSLALKQYGVLLAQQTYDRCGLVIDNAVRKSIHTVHQIPSQDVGEFIERRYLGFMLDAKRREDEHELTLLRRDLMHSAQGKLYEPEIVSICRHVRIHHETNRDLLDAYVQIVKAIENDDLIAAANLKKKIEAIESKK